VAVRGSKPRPAGLKALEGGQKNATTPAVPSSLGDPPPHLGIHGKQEWARVLEYADLGVIRTPEVGSVIALCSHFQMAMGAEIALAENGLTQVTPNGLVQQRAEVATARNAWKEYRQFASELGLTPTSRTRLEIPEPKDESPMARLLKGAG
jgi:P27 family predicted phage terminase small subunit